MGKGTHLGSPSAAGEQALAGSEGSWAASVCGFFLCLLFLPTSASCWQCSLFSGAWARSLGPVHIKNTEAETPGGSLWLALRQPHSLQPRGRAGAQAQALVPSLAGDK